MTTVTLRLPESFTPGGRMLNNHLEHDLRRFGFEEGYPLYGVREFDPSWLVHAIVAFADPRLQPQLPSLHVDAVLDNCTTAASVALDVDVDTLHCDWGLARWRSLPGDRDLYMRGRLHKVGRDQTWLIGRRKVYDYVVHLFVDVKVRSGRVQLVPIGHARKAFPPTCEGFMWATALPRLHRE